jgi:hypothetical protein
MLVLILGLILAEGLMLRLTLGLTERETLGLVLIEILAEGLILELGL